MRCCSFIVALLLVACKSHEPVQVAAIQEWTVPPLGFVGDWVQVWPASRRGDTLTLRADSSASGLAPGERGVLYADLTTESPTGR